MVQRNTKGTFFAYFGEEFVAEDLVQVQPVAGHLLQHTADELLCGGREVGGQVVANLLYALVGLLQVQRLKGRVAAHQRVPFRGNYNNVSSANIVSDKLYLTFGQNE